MVIQKFKKALAKMSQRAMWRGDASQSHMIDNHGLEGMRHNFVSDTATHNKDVIGFNKTARINNQKDADTNQSKDSKANNNSKSLVQNKNTNSLGGNILDSLK